MGQTLIKEKKYSGCYVAIEDFDKGVVISSGKDPQKVYEEAVKKGYFEPVIAFIPSKDIVQIYWKMELSNIPFRKLGPDDIARPWLPVTAINPYNNKRIKIFGLIDTGADECALPARYASILGHNLEAGFIKEINTGNGKTTAYSHTVRIEISGFTIQDTLIDFMPNLYVPLLGVKSFLSNFILTIDYPRQIFSLRK